MRGRSEQDPQTFKFFGIPYGKCLLYEDRTIYIQVQFFLIRLSYVCKITKLFSYKLQPKALSIKQH